MIYDVEINSAAHYPAADVPGLIELAEQVGFGAFWKGESNSTDPIVMLSAVASRTKNIKLGTAIYHIYGRSPVTLGIQAATLQDLSGGRLLLGLGVANKSHRGLAWRCFRSSAQARARIHRHRAQSRCRRTSRIRRRDLSDRQTLSISWKPSYPNLPIYLAGLDRR